MTTKINNEHKKLNVPNLRFPEFQGEWSVKTIKDLAMVIGGGTPDTSIKSFWDGDIQWFTPSEIGKNKYVDCSSRTISEEGLNNSSAKLLPPNTILLSSRATIGECSISLRECATNQGFQSLMAKDCNTEFLYYLIQTKKKDLIRKSCGSTFLEISANEVRKIQGSVPSDAEQKKIAKLLSLLDERIAAQNKIIDKLQSLIKGLEDNLLDNPLWEKTYLRSFMQFFSTNSLSWEQLSYEEGEIRNLHYGLIHGFQTRGINSASLPMVKNEAKPKQYTLCQVGDVAFADASEDTGEIAKSVEFVDTIEVDTICGLHTIHGRDIKNRTVVGFKGFAFNSRYFHNQIKRLAQGTKVFSITANNLSSCYVYLPDLETQKAIVELLKAYEAQLIVSRKTLKQYEKQKKYLLRQMFI